MILKSLTPASRAAMTKSSFRRAINRPRTVRARPVQPMKDRMMVMYRYMAVTEIPGGMAADRASHRGMLGTAEMTSMIRWIRLSIQPPK